MQTVHTDSPADQPALHDAHVAEFWEWATDPARDFEQPAGTHDHEAPTDAETQAANRAMLAEAARPKQKKPSKASKAKKPQPKRPGNPTGSTFDGRDIELVRSVLIQRLDDVLLGVFDAETKEFDARGCPLKVLCDRHGLSWEFGIDLVQEVQLALFPEEFGEPDDLPGLIPNAEEARTLLSPVNGARFRLYAESVKPRTAASKAVCADTHLRLEQAVLHA